MRLAPHDYAVGEHVEVLRERVGKWHPGVVEENSDDVFLVIGYQYLGYWTRARFNVNFVRPYLHGRIAKIMEDRCARVRDR